MPMCASPMFGPLWTVRLWWYPRFWLLGTTFALTSRSRSGHVRMSW